MLKELIHTKIDEVFAEYKEANNITNGDIDPWEAARLERIEEALADVVRRVCASQQEKINFDDFAPSWYVYTDGEGNAYSKTFGQISADFFFTNVSKKIAYDDCNDERVHRIYYKGREVFYAGWQPNMKYEYKDLNGNTVWVGEFPEWDH